MTEERTDAPRYSTVQVRRRRAFALRASVALVVVIGLLFVVVFPVSAWLDQRASLSQAEQRLATLRRERQRLDRTAHRLRSDAEVERLAREKYGMVHPGEQAYVAVPGSPTTTTTTTLPVAP
ncbi:MAG: septum formation initiator family protein [Acidimicrobiia bacterium]